MVGFLARRLIWKFQDSKRHSAGIWHDGRFLDSRDGPLTWLTDETHVQLWHPLDEEPSAVLAWRALLEAHQIQQPFKQAHREIYVLTDAERQAVCKWTDAALGGAK